MDKLGDPFKYNSSWSNLYCFHSFVKSSWVHYHDGHVQDSSQFVVNLKTLKKKVKEWNDARWKAREGKLLVVELDLDNLYNSDTLVFVDGDWKEAISPLEKKEIE